MVICFGAIVGAPDETALNRLAQKRHWPCVGEIIRMPTNALKALCPCLLVVKLKVFLKIFATLLHIC